LNGRRKAHTTKTGEDKTIAGRQWDAANRLVAINYIGNGNRTEFAYDGMGRRVKIIEYNEVTTATVEPPSARYETFTTESFTVPSGNYTLRFQGLNANGGENTALVDAVMLDDALIPNGSFESPVVEDYQYQPIDTAWSYGGSAGIAATAALSRLAARTRLMVLKPHLSGQTVS
jgi:YD repeat-containing protein